MNNLGEIVEIISGESMGPEGFEFRNQIGISPANEIQKKQIRINQQAFAAVLVKKLPQRG
ncbi:MAG: hypothetical protein AAB466_11850 [Verrucomicrobiota bacterium]